MKIGFVLFGILYGRGDGSGTSPNGQSGKDFRHCWNNIKQMLIEPFIEQGHEAKIYVSSYPLNNDLLEKELIDTVKPRKICYSNFKGSSGFTTKYAAFEAIKDEDLDVIVLTRNDIHFSKKIANDNIDFKKFNFLFPEQDHWDNLRFTTDNFYMWPHKFTSLVKQSLRDQYGTHGSTTHNLYNSLIKYIPASDINIISPTHELSHLNSYYTLCRDGLDKTYIDKIHPEVRSRFFKDIS